jgi:hypothetical protein
MPCKHLKLQLLRVERVKDLKRILLLTAFKDWKSLMFARTESKSLKSKFLSTNNGKGKNKIDEH